MKKKRIFLLIVTVFTFCDNPCVCESSEKEENKLAHVNDETRIKFGLPNGSEKVSEPLYPNSTIQVTPRERHHRERSKKNRNKARCRRYAQQFYQPYQRVPTYVQIGRPGEIPIYLQRGKAGEVVLPPNLLPPPYLDPIYTPTRCKSFCVPCPTSSCRRRCPTPSPIPIRSTEITRITDRAKTTTRPPTPTTNKGAQTYIPSATIYVIPKFPCNCDSDGSKFPMCNVTSGECVCKPHFTGITCNICEDGFWKNKLFKECIPCECNEHGAVASICHKQSGRCSCKAGVTGDKCDSCLPDHYGKIQYGCKKCDPCNKKGHVCDPDNGKCVCPPLTTGNECQVCAVNAWGYEPDIGCKACNCSELGSAKLQCDKTHGTCSCKKGFEGEKCDKCSVGYYGYPSCRKCNCDIKGTKDEECQNGVCRCSSINGLCTCKENVQGQKCNKCKEKNYGLTKSNPKGCTNCFCFNRSDTCEDAHYNWDKIRMEKEPIDTNNIEEEITDTLMLPKRFLGDLTPSYGGYLGVSVPGGTFQVDLEGNGLTLRSTGTHELQMIESSDWTIISGNSDFPESCSDVLTRSCFMVALQRVTKFRIVAQGKINEVLLDTAKSNMPTYTFTHSTEKCECPKEYTGLSCQDPNKGFYRYFPKSKENNWIDVVVGVAKPCECNNKSTQCDPNTGHCTNCSDHTTGNQCELCGTGYYKNKDGRCSACLCPSDTQNNAESCSPTPYGFICKCKKGYAGVHCEKCDTGYYDKSPLSGGTICEPCNCNPYGTITNSENSCDKFGKCVCKNGFTGDKCDKCDREREYIKNGICSPCDECTQKLFDQIDDLQQAVNETFDLFKNGLAPPWKILTDNLNRHGLLSGKFELIRNKSDNFLKNANISQYEDDVTSIKNKLEATDNMAESNLVNVDKLYDDSTKLIHETDAVNKELTETIKILDKFGNERISLEDALKRAHEIDKEIKQISDRINKLNDKNVHAFCSNISKAVDTIYSMPPVLPYDSINNIKNKLSDLIDTTAYVETISQLAEKKNLYNTQKLQELKEKIKKLNEKNDETTGNIGEIKRKIDAINDVMEQIELILEDFKDMSEFDKEYEKLDSRIRRQTEESQEIDTLYLRAMDHVNELEAKVNEYNSLFNFTKEEWTKINASGAYEAIIKGIYEAKNNVKMTREILENATRIIDPENVDNLVVKTNLAHAYSDRLRQRINNFKDISKDLSQIRNKLDDLKYAILENGKSNNDLTQALHKMEAEITSQTNRVVNIQDAIKDSTDVSETMRELEKKVNDIQFEKQHIFFKDYENFLNLTTTDSINNLTETLKYTRDSLQNLNISATHFDIVKNFTGQNKNNDIKSVQEKLRKLQQKINYAKQTADMISVPMNLTNCFMTYKPPKQLFETLSITFKCSSCSLFKWVKNTENSLSLDVTDFALLLTVDNTTKVIAGWQIPTEQTVTIRKVGSMLEISMNEYMQMQKMVSVSGVYKSITTNDRFTVGSNEENYVQNVDQYIYRVLLNDKIIGLWNFKTTNGHCRGQKRDKTDIPNSDLVPYFKGDGYRVYGINKLDPSKLTWTFDLTTFDENSLMYLATTNNCKQFIGLYLDKGYAKFMVHHDEQNKMILNSTQPLNDGTNYKVEITMQYKNGQQHYNLIIRNDTADIVKASDSNKLLNTKVIKIREANHFVGGVPPTFNKPCVPFNTISLLGYLDLGTPLTNETASYGFTNVKKKVLAFSNVWINKSGFIILCIDTGFPNSISFILKPAQAHGFILELSYIAVYLRNYSIYINYGNERYKSSITLNKKDYNDINIKIHSFNSYYTTTVGGQQEDFIGVSITINGKQDENWEEIAKIIKNEEVLFGDMAPSGQKCSGNQIMKIGGDEFSGGIQEILINNEPILFNYSSIMDFSNVEIGRDKDVQTSPISKIYMKSIPINSNFTNSMQNTERCAPFTNYVTDPDAIKFGDKPNSYTHIKTNFWKTDFAIEFKFRTFYSNGVIFIACSKTLQNYIFFELREGKLNLIIKGKKKRVPIAFGKKVNDGSWHSIEFTRKKRKLTIVIDKEQKKPIRIPKSNVKDEIYLGGVPTNSEYMRIKDLKDKLHPFRGCMKSLIINGEHKFLIKNTKDITHSNIRQCFPNEEEGAYFGGDAFAVYKENYQVNKILELSFEFRTTEQNGILLSVSNFRNSPALSVELQNGAVVMAVDMGNGVVSKVTNNLDSDFALCNNHWHNVTALYSSSELTVNVDGIRKSWVQSEINSMIDEIEAPLYIGGLPDDAPIGTLKSRENFKGCIRKLKIEDKLMDWSDMKELNNVLLNSCPVIQENDISINNQS